jgi:hypothetical protein
LLEHLDGLLSLLSVFVKETQNILEHWVASRRLAENSQISVN